MCFGPFTCNEGRGMCMLSIPWTPSSTWSFPEALWRSPVFSEHMGKTPLYTLQISQCRKRYLNPNGAVDWVTGEFFYLKERQCRQMRWWGWWIIRLQRHWSAPRRTHECPKGCSPIHGALPILGEKDKAWFSSYYAFWKALQFKSFYNLNNCFQFNYLLKCKLFLRWQLNLCWFAAQTFLIVENSCAA